MGEISTSPSTVHDAPGRRRARCRRQELPSARLTRLAELTAADLQRRDRQRGSCRTAGAAVEQALADVLAAVDASTAANTKAAYRSDWARFTGWAAERGFAPLPAPTRWWWRIT